MPKKPKRVPRTKEPKTIVQRLAAQVQREVRTRLGPNATFEQRRDAAAELMREVLWKDADDDLRAAVTDADEVDVDDHRYRRLEPPSSATYYGRWGPHTIDEARYRQVGIHNGPTVKPIELRVGIIEHMTPDLARIVGALSAERSSRAVERTLRIVGHVPPGRAFLAARTTNLGTAIADDLARLEDAARVTEPLPAKIAALSCGLDRMSVRMSEPAAAGSPAALAPPRTAPYERTPPSPREHHYRKAWVGSVSVYDAAGTELHTWRYGVEADADPAALATRVAADVGWILRAHPGVPVHCIQDAAPELRALPEALALALPADTTVVELVDFEHLMGYLETVVDACESANDPHDLKGWYRGELLRDDRAIDRIWRGLREKATRLPTDQTKAHDAVAAAQSYIDDRRSKMRYASHYEANLPIGSGATESTCWQMQQRVKLPGQSWETPGLRGVLAIRGLVLSERWNTAWPSYAAKYRKEVTIAA